MASTFQRGWLSRLSKRFLGRPRRPACSPRRRPALAVERLEQRLTPSITLNGSFNGLNINDTQGFVPPDTQGAAGSGHTYIQTVNQTLAIYNKSTGATIAGPTNFDTFLYNTGGLPPTNGQSFLSDPIIVWDDQIGRFIIGDQDVDFGAIAHVSNFDLAVSKSADPATLTTADWNFFQVNTTENIAGGANDDYDADYPGNFGYNHDDFVFTLNMFPNNTTSGHVEVNAVNIAALTAPTPTLVVNKQDVNGLFSLRPTVMHDSVAGDPMWLVGEAGDGSHIDLVRMDNPDVPALTTFTTFSLAVTPYSGAVATQDPGGVITANTDSRIMKAAEMNHMLVASHAVSNAAGDRDLARWYEFDVSNPSNPVVMDQGNVVDAASGAGGAGVYDNYASVDINAAGAIGMTYMQSGTTQFLSAYDTGRIAGDAAGTMEAPVLVQAGGGLNFDGREGDMAAINIDTDGSFWATTEWTDAASNWNEKASHFTITPPFTTDVALNAGNLVVTDIALGGKNDALSITLNGANVRVRDLNALFLSHAGETLVDPHTVDVPLALITGNVQVNTLGGNDSLTVDFSNGNPVPHGLAFDGGTGTNQLVLLGGNLFTNEVETPTGAKAGAIVFDANPAISYANTAEVDDAAPITGTATYKGTSAAEAIGILDGHAINGLAATQISSGASGTFAPIFFTDKPTVVVNGVGGADAFTLNNPNRAAALTSLKAAAGAAGSTFGVTTTAANIVTTAVGGAGNDSFTVSAALASGATLNIDGGGGTNTLKGPNSAATWNVTSANAGGVTGIVSSFANVQNLTGGSGADSFVLSSGASIAGTVDGGGGGNSFDYSAFTTPIAVNLQSGAATATGGIIRIQTLVGGQSTSDALVAANTGNAWHLTGQNAGDINGTFRFTSIENLTGGSGADSFLLGAAGGVSGTLDGGAGVNVLTGTNQDTTWAVTGTNAGNIAGIPTFVNIQNLTGGSGADTFVFSDGAAVAGTVDGGAGANTIDYSGYTTPVTVKLLGLGAPGAGGFANIQHFIGGQSSGDTLIGADTANTWHITGLNAGDVNGTILFSSFENLTGGKLNDTFLVAPGAGLAGVIDGGAGPNLLVVDAAGRPVQTQPGEIFVAGVPTAGYTSNMSQLSINNPAAVNALGGPDTADRANALTGLSPDQRFVQAVYLDVLGRPGSPSELAGWATLFSPVPGQHAQGQAIIVSGIEHSLEAADHRVKSWYVAYLGRQAQNGEEVGWAGMLQGGQTEEFVLSLILATPEAYARAQALVPTGTADQRYAASLFQLLLHRSGSAGDVNYVANLVTTYGRQATAQTFLWTAEFRTYQFEGYVDTLLRRPASPSYAPNELNNMVFSSIDMGTVRIGLEDGAEFYYDG